MNYNRTNVSSQTISELLSKYFGVKVNPKHSKQMVLCPWHQDHQPSLSIDDEKGVFHCFSCGEKGNVITLLKKAGLASKHLVTNRRGEVYSNQVFLRAPQKLLDDLKSQQMLELWNENPPPSDTDPEERRKADYQEYEQYKARLREIRERLNDLLDIEQLELGIDYRGELSRHLDELCKQFKHRRKEFTDLKSRLSESGYSPELEAEVLRLEQDAVKGRRKRKALASCKPGPVGVAVELENCRVHWRRRRCEQCNTIFIDSTPRSCGHRLCPGCRKAQLELFLVEHEDSLKGISEPRLVILPLPQAQLGENITEAQPAFKEVVSRGRRVLKAMSKLDEPGLKGMIYSIRLSFCGLQNRSAFAVLVDGAAAGLLLIMGWRQAFGVMGKMETYQDAKQALLHSGSHQPQYVCLDDLALILRVSRGMKLLQGLGTSYRVAGGGGYDAKSRERKQQKALKQCPFCGGNLKGDGYQDSLDGVVKRDGYLVLECDPRNKLLEELEDMEYERLLAEV
jgi:hypothetical protein